MLGPLDGNLVLPLADGALHPEHQLLGGLRLLPQDGLGLTSKALLLAIVPVMFIFEANQNNFFSNVKCTSFCPGPAWTQRISCTGSPKMKAMKRNTWESGKKGPQTILLRV